MIWRRIKTLWKLSGVEYAEDYEISTTGQREGDAIGIFKRKQYAEFILPNRTKEIFTRKSDATIDDVL